MADLRKKQRQRRERAIVEAMKQLIVDKGYRNTSVEEIAEAAEVGPATIYNYFGSKYGIIISVFTEEMDRMLKEGEEIIKNPPDSAEEAVYELVRAYYGDLAERYNKKLMREVFAAALIEQLSVRKEVMGMDWVVLGQLTRLIEIIKKRGQIAPDVDVTEATFAIFSLILTDLMVFFMDDDTQIEDFLKAMRGHIDFLFRGFGSPVRDK